MLITNEFKEQIFKELLAARERYTDSDAQFAAIYKINKSVFSRIRNGERERILSETHLLIIANDLGINPEDNTWKLARTEPFEVIEEGILICKRESVGMFFVDCTDIGKTATSKYVCRQLTNSFYVDCSQHKTKQQFVRAIARAAGVESTGRYVDVKNALKLALKLMAAQDKPVFILDEYGDVEYPAFLETKELMNATVGQCGWMFLGADGLKAKMESGKNRNKVGFAEMFRRGGAKYRSVVPINRNDRPAWYSNMIGQALLANGCPKADLSKLIAKCIVKDEAGNIYGLSRAKVILKHHLMGEAV